MRAAMVRVWVVAGILGIAAIASCTGDEGPTGPAGATGATGATGAAGPTGPAEVEVFTATLLGTNEVPSNTSAGTGTATITMVGGQLLFRVDVGNISNVTDSHIHATGAAGVIAGTVVDFFLNSGGGTPRSFTTTATLAQGVGNTPRRMSMDSLVVLMRNGNAYVNVHTTQIPGGEIRGQIVRKP